MAYIIIPGAGLGGMLAAYEIRVAIGKEHTITVIGDRPILSFIRSNPWLVVGRRKPDDIRIVTRTLSATSAVRMERSGIRDH